LKEFLRPINLGVAAYLGSGKQIVSWIHIDDIVNMYIRAIEDENMSGSYNAVAPNPVTNKELTIQLARSRRKHFIVAPVPAIVLKTMMGQMSIEVLKSATVSSAKIEAAGFTFQYPDLKDALAELRESAL
jgi:NAD dependent epimerase/dehydratase family enzyme